MTVAGRILRSRNAILQYCNEHFADMHEETLKRAKDRQEHGARIWVLSPGHVGFEAVQRGAGSVGLMLGL